MIKGRIVVLDVCALISFYSYISVGGFGCGAGLKRSDTGNMFAVVVLVFMLIWAVATALVGLVSFGAAPLWLLLGGPLVVATWLASTFARLAKPARELSQRGGRILASTRRVGASAMDVLALFPSFAAGSLLFVYALPFGNDAETVGVLVALLASLLAAARIAKAIRLPACEGV